MKPFVSACLALFGLAVGLVFGSSRGFAADVIWSDDAVPAGASQASGGDDWNWVASNPAPAFGALAHRSNLAAGLHEHFFNFASETLSVAAGDVLFAYVYIDPANVPSQIMLSWNADGWEHRAYWGVNAIGYGNDGTASRRSMGAMPAAGQWVRLEVPASVVGLEGSTITGMGFSHFDGRATWDRTGTGSAAPITAASAVSDGVNETIWSDDAVPAGALELHDGKDSWRWVTAQPAPVSGAAAHQSADLPGLHEHFFNYASAPLAVATGEVMFAYVYIDPVSTPTAIMLSWNADGWEHRAYWGANAINYGTDGTAGRLSMGPLPAAGQWVRLEVPAAAVGLENLSVTGMGFSTFGGRATWDKAGKASGFSQTSAPPTASTSPTPAITATDIAWMDDAVPGGAVELNDGRDTWEWSTSVAPMSGQRAHQSRLLSGLHEHQFNYAYETLSVATGEGLFAYVYIDPASPPTEIMLSWNADGWEHRAYWGANAINYGTDGTAGRRHMGALPATGQWVRLEIPASAVDLEGRTISGMGFSQFDGRATWDKVGKYTASTSASPVAPAPIAPVIVAPPAPATSSPSAGDIAEVLRSFNIDGTSLELARVGDSLLHVLSPTLLELKLINTKAAGAAQVSAWNFVDDNGNFTAPSTSKFSVVIGGNTVSVTAVGFKRRVAYAPLVAYDLRIENSLYLQLASPIADDSLVQVTNPDGSLWAATQRFSALADARRYSPAIHVNQEGYVPTMPKKAMIGYFLGDMGEMNIPASSGFAVIDARTGAIVYSGSLALRQDIGYNTSPLPYQKVLVADFSDFTTPGEYQLQVAGLGASLPFVIDDGVAMGFARTYALGLYHQRSGVSQGLPFTRFARGADHTARALVPVQGDQQFNFTWNCIAGYGGVQGADNPAQTAVRLVSEATQLYPFVNQGSVDVSGGHWDAGDYSKYTINSAQLTHHLMFTADSIAGANQLDNLGIPESGDGISDILQEAKVEADYLSKLQDADGGFYFIVYPQNREYESGTMPDRGDQQVVWPKNTSATAAAVAALAQTSSSPQFKAAYPAAAAQYLQQARLGWQFLSNAIARHGKAGAYQKITFYGDHWTHDDELAWAACELFLATGEAQFAQKLAEYFPNPTDSSTFRWGWWRMSESWGNAIRSYAFAARSGRLPSSALDANYLAACEAQVVAAGDDVVDWSNKNAYATPFPIATKRVRGAGWYFSLDQASDAAVAFQIIPKPAYIETLVGAMNYEAGTNPVNITYLTGIGLKRQREIVHQFAVSDRRVLPPSGIPLGNIQASFDYLQNYGSTLGALSYPGDNAAAGCYPFYDRWSDTFNVTTEFITVNQARSILATGFLATRTTSASRLWTSAAAEIVVPAATALLETPVTLTVSVPGMDLAGARIVWEARDQEPAFGSSYTISPKNNGPQWVEVEITWTDGRRAFGAATFNANSPVVTWVNGAVPAGGNVGTSGGDSWNWTSSLATPSGKPAHQSNLASGLHEHWFTGAAATMEVASGDTMFMWVYLDPVYTPTEIMVSWCADGWEHRAFWGADRISYGTLGGPGRHRAGDLPTAGQWVKLSVPASVVGLEGHTVSGMTFSTFDGRSTWDGAGKAQ